MDASKTENALRGVDAETRLFAAISILQNYIAGEDTVLVREKIFGGGNMPMPSLELCERLLSSLVVDLEKLGHK